MTKRERILAPLVIVVLLAICTLADLPIATTLYSHNLYGVVFEVIGELPFTFLTVFAFALLFRFRAARRGALHVLLGVVYAALALLFSLMGGFMTWNYLHENVAGAPQFLAPVIALALCGAAFLLARRVPRENARQAVTFAIIAIVYFLAVILVMNSVKALWGRMRIREMTDPATQFTRWYVITPRGGFDNAYASFPSGHAMNATGTLLFCLLPSFLPGLTGKESALKLMAYAWIVLVGVSRIVAGAHFASDVAAGVLLSLLLFEGIRALVCRARKTRIPEGAA